MNSQGRGQANRRANDLKWPLAARGPRAPDRVSVHDGALPSLTVYADSWGGSMSREV